jgi:hypothetical protein
MQTENIVLDRGEARALYRKYREHQHYAQPIDWEIQRTYQLIAQGRLVIKALDSIATAGVGEDGYPKLAIVRADAATCYFQYQASGGGRFAKERWVKENHRRSYIDLPPGSFRLEVARERRRDWVRAEATVLLIPINLRPKRGLENYHLVWEAVWRPAPPVDPMLLRRIGLADLWVVLAAWDLTPIEQAALAARIGR